MLGELVETFARLIRKGDKAYFLPIYYAGATVRRDISSGDLADLVSQRGVASYAPPNRGVLIASLKKCVNPHDVVILMGARDPSLSLPVQEIKKALSRPAK